MNEIDPSVEAGKGGGDALELRALLPQASPSFRFHSRPSRTLRGPERRESDEQISRIYI
jgi:hypothetical protein